jgi:hypothetical protein
MFGQTFKNKAESPDTIEYKIGEIFGEIKNKIQNDAASILGSTFVIKETFLGFQKYFYEAR